MITLTGTLDGVSDSRTFWVAFLCWCDCEEPTVNSQDVQHIDYEMVFAGGFDEEVSISYDTVATLTCTIDYTYEVIPNDSPAAGSITIIEDSDTDIRVVVNQDHDADLDGETIEVIVYAEGQDSGLGDMTLFTVTFTSECRLTVIDGPDNTWPVLTTSLMSSTIDDLVFDEWKDDIDSGNSPADDGKCGDKYYILIDDTTGLEFDFDEYNGFVGTYLSIDVDENVWPYEFTITLNPDEQYYPVGTQSFTLVIGLEDYPDVATVDQELLIEITECVGQIVAPTAPATYEWQLGTDYETLIDFFDEFTQVDDCEATFSYEVDFVDSNGDAVDEAFLSYYSNSRDIRIGFNADATATGTYTATVTATLSGLIEN